MVNKFIYGKRNATLAVTYFGQQTKILVNGKSNAKCLVKQIVILLVVPTIICIEMLAYWKWQLFHFIATQKLNIWELKSGYLYIYVLNRCLRISTEALGFRRKSKKKKIRASNSKEIIFRKNEKFSNRFKSVCVKLSEFLHDYIFVENSIQNNAGSWIIMEWTIE